MPSKGLHTVINDPPIIYLAVPKAGATTIRASLLESMGETDLSTVHDKKDQLNLHHNYQVFHKKNHFKFTFVRNPIDRIISCYLNKLYEKDFKSFHRFGFYHKMDFEEFVNGVVKIPEHKADVHFAPQKFLLSYKDKYLSDFTGKVENFKEDWQLMIEQSGHPDFFHPNPVKRNISSSVVGELLTPKIEAKIRHYYRQDFEFFDYE